MFYLNIPMNEKVKKSLPLIVFVSTILIGLLSLFISYRVSGILPGEMFPAAPYGTTPPGGGVAQPTTQPNDPAATPNPGTTYNAGSGACGAASQQLQEPVEAPKSLPFWKKILNSIFNLLGLTKRGAEMFPLISCDPCCWAYDEETHAWFPSDSNGNPLPGGPGYNVCQPPTSLPNIPTTGGAGCPGPWNCWPNEGTWKAAFCDQHPGQCQNDTQPPDWAYNDVADAVNFVQQNGRGPTPDEWIDRWHTGHTWGDFDGKCPAGGFARDDGTCYLLGFQPGANTECPSGCALTDGPHYDSGGHLTSITCDCPTDGQCGPVSGGGGGLGYFTDLDCPCTDTDPSTVCGNGEGDDDTAGDDDDDTGGPTPTPLPTPTPTPTPTFQCESLGPEPPEDLQPGQSLDFTCTASIEGEIAIDHYNFQVLDGDETLVPESEETIPASSLTDPLQAGYTFIIPETGAPFTVQCQVCTSSDDSACTTWGQQN